ncbi:MAG: glycosyltransferase family 4 protein [Gemmatimonadaceae bacterium]
MRVLIVHHEARYYGGAEILLGHFLLALRESGSEITVALARESHVASAVPTGVEVVWLPENERFSPGNFSAQLRALARICRSREFDVVHGWAARDWELAAVVGAWARHSTIGTLHDHPRATYISPKRQRLMRLVANRGLDRVVCTSNAVHAACIHAGYRVGKLAVIHNGIPIPREVKRPDRVGLIRFGFLGVFSEGKGLSGLFEMADLVDALHPGAWELRMGGAAQNQAAERLIASIRAQHSAASWWPRVRWCGWIEDQMAFLREVDVLVCPFTEFEAFGLVLCEAAAAGLPVVATNIGAIPEIVEHERTGWLFQPGDWHDGARILGNLIRHPEKRTGAGEKARQRVEQKFTIAEMVSGYVNLYSELG